MKIQVLGAAAALAIITGTQVFAADAKGEITLDFTTNASDNIVMTPTVDMSLEGDVAVGSIGLTVDNATDGVKLDTYSVGVKLGTDATVSFGDQGDLMDGFEGATEAVGGSTLVNLDDEGESIKVEAGKLAVAARFTDLGSDVTDLSSLQATYATALNNLSIAGGVDYNLDTKDATTFASAGVDMGTFGVGGTMTYQDAFGYELNASYGAMGAFLNGDENDALQNIGGGLYGEIAGGMSYYGEVGYNVDSEEFTPAAGVAFKF